MSDGLKRLGDFLEKAEGGSHKYESREGTPGHYQYTYSQPGAGATPIAQTTTGQPVHEMQRGPHSVKDWGEVLVTQTTPGHEQETPRHLEHGGKHWVRAGYNTDNATVGYHEYQPARHIMDPATGFAREAVPVEAKGVSGGLYHVAGLPQKAGGELPDEINDPHHGKLTVRGHNSDSGMTVYHKDVHHPGWNKPAGEQAPGAPGAGGPPQHDAAGPGKPPQGIGPNQTTPAKAPPPPPPKATPPTPQAQQPGATPAGGGQPPRPGSTPTTPLVGGAQPPGGIPPPTPGAAPSTPPGQMPPKPGQPGQAPMMSGPPTAWQQHGQTGPAAKPPTPAPQGPQVGPAPQTPPGAPPPQGRQVGSTPAAPPQPAQAAQPAQARPPVAGTPAAQPAKPAQPGRKPFGKSMGLDELGDWLEKSDKIHGGLADSKTPKDFDRAALAQGQKVEMEHTDDPAKAREIAMDHLTEDPDYYTKLARMESGDNAKKSEVDEAIEAFFQRNPHPDDSEVHALAGRLGINPHVLETRIYAIAGKRMAKCGMAKAELTPQKARKILHDKEVRGHPLTDQQRKYFGAVASGSARKSMEHNMKTGLEALGDYLSKSNDDPMPDDKCKLGYNKSKELGESPDGGDLAGKTRDFSGDRVGDAKGGSGGKEGTSGIGAPSPAKSVAMGAGAGTPEDVGGNPSIKEEALNDEERSPEKQMTDGKTAVEEEVREKSLTPAGQRAMVAREHALKVQELTKSEDVRVGVPDHPYMMTSMGDVDSATESLLKSEFYVGGREPTLAQPGTVIRAHVMCKSEACGTRFPAFYTSCPECGNGQTVNRLLPRSAHVGGASGMILEKSACDPIIRPTPKDGDVMVGEPENPVVVRIRR